jgi:hypothetical protein
MNELDASQYGKKVLATETFVDGWGHGYDFLLGHVIWGLSPFNSFLNEIEDQIKGKAINAQYDSGIVYFNKKIPNPEIIDSAFKKHLAE